MPLLSGLVHKLWTRCVEGKGLERTLLKLCHTPSMLALLEDPGVISD